MKQYGMWFLAGLLVLSLCGAGSALAQTAAPAAGVEAGLVEQGAMSWQEVIRNGGKLMYVLGGMSFLTVAFVIYFLAVLRVGQVVPRPLHRELIEKIRAGALDDARRACEYKSCPLASVALSAIDYIRHVSAPDTMLLKDVVEGEGRRQVENMEGQTQYLMDIASISPMIGLLGTVFGMLRAFSSVAMDMASAKPVNLAAGVSQALITTAFGLIVGIPAMMFYAYFRRRAAKLAASLEIASADVLTALLSRGHGQGERTGPLA